MRQIANMNWFCGKVGPLNLYPVNVWPLKPPHWLCCSAVAAAAAVSFAIVRQCLWFDGLWGGCGNISDSVFTWIVTHDHHDHIHTMPKSKMEYKAGSMSTEYCVIYIHLTKTSYGHNRCNRQPEHSHRAMYLTLAMEMCAQTKWKVMETDKNNHRGIGIDSGDSSAHSAYTTVSINC